MNEYALSLPTPSSIFGSEHFGAGGALIAIDHGIYAARQIPDVYTDN